MERSEILNIDQLYIVGCFVNSIKSVFYLLFYLGYLKNGIKII